MNRGPMPGARAAPTNFRDRVLSAWGPDAPAWIGALADEAQRTTATAVAERIGYSPSVVSQVLSASYRGNLSAVEARVRGALMGATVGCPVLGDIGLDRCRREQKRPPSSASPIRARLSSNCRICRHRTQETPDVQS